MKNRATFIIWTLLLLLSFGYISELTAHLEETLLSDEPESIKSNNVLGLEITNFIEGSNLKKAGAQIGDIVIMYNGKKVSSIKDLGVLKESITTPEVEIVLQRGDNEITLTIPKGQIGAYLKEIVPEHKIDDDAVIIEGIDKLSWGMNMDNSFLCALHRIDEKFGQNISYEDISGLSGYAFRLQFFDGWCPSSPDATCGKDVGAEILKKLGYNFNVYHMATEFMNEDMKESAITEDEIRKIMMKSIDSGWPVIAIDLIEIPEWGIVTGYQKDGKEFFCRTYFDKTKGYEIAKKMPWVIYVITDKQKVDITPQYKNSLLLAKELYNTEKYDNYFSGIKAIHEWINALQDEKYFDEIDDKGFEETNLANWWIYFSLMLARDNAKQYLLDNIERFDVDSEIISKLAALYASEVEILKNGFQYVPSSEMVKNRIDWNQEMREKQTKILKVFLTIEKEVNNLFNKI
ncbi:MAG: PDZ domain-containing protein [Candidatus Cloacimonetes bacterium]|nr:PDZ domain-containing protein [Candidatus Cloacimonadota bacterium]MBL7087006.1 PDZ domain-containing protein [Candidatus Cloacimonadota bacterium]